MNSRLIKHYTGVTLTPREALEIQRKQVEFYAPRYPQLPAAVEKANNLEGLEMDTPYPVREINRRILRGAWLGALIGEQF